MPKHNLSFEALGTQWAIETEVRLSTELIDRIHQRIELFDATYSRFRADSLVTKVATQKGSFTFPADADNLFKLYRNLYGATAGKVTPLIGEMLERAGYDAAYSLQPKAQQQLPKWDEAMTWQSPVLTTTRPIVLDVGAAGKGYLVDIICSILDAGGIGNYIVDASGDLSHKGTMENKVGLEDPRDPTKIIGVIDIRNKSLCASASNRRAWGDDLHHIFDPDVATPTTEIIASWVIADEAMVADGIATALFFTDPNVVAASFEFGFARMHADGSIDYSYAFEGKL